MTIRIQVEVTDELVMDGRKQVAYVDAGDRYPVREEIWCGKSGGSRRPGTYVATRLKRDTNGKYPPLVVDFDSLVPDKGAKAA